MQKSILVMRFFLFILISLISINLNAQTGLNFQGVARTSNNIIIASQAITIKLSILQGSSAGPAEYTETRRVTTNAQGLFTAVIGDTGAISTLGNYATINWKYTPKFLKIEMDPTAGNNFITMGTTQFQYVAYAQFANSVDAENIVGVVPVARGGTGAISLSILKTSLALDKVNNTEDLTKPISAATQVALDFKLNVTDTSKYVKKIYTDSALLTKLSITGNAVSATSATSAASAGTASTATKLATARNINGVAFDGSSDITITSIADAGTLTGTTLKSTVTGSSLTSVGKLVNLTVTNPIVGSITGNASTAGTSSTTTKLATARNINGVAFDGSADITITTIADAGTLTGTTLKSTVTGSSLTSVGKLANLTVTDPIVGSITGNAATATSAITASTAGTSSTTIKLATARKINGVYFDGTEDVTIDKLKAGDEFGGGIVIFTWANGKHGLIAAMSNLNIGGTDAWKWSSSTNKYTMAKSDGIGAGYRNMLLILARQGLEVAPYAASVCNEFKVDLGSSYNDVDNYVWLNEIMLSDWYLPSKYELQIIDDFALQYSGNDPNPNWTWTSPGLSTYGYWSSNEVNADSAWYFGSPIAWVEASKTELAHVRPIRMF
jgi:hypothetical protein